MRAAASIAILLGACGARTGLELALDAAPSIPEPTCDVPAPERCNAEDDDCDGRADEGLGFGPLGPPIVVRTDEGTGGGCGSCRWAGGAALAILDDRMIATWRLGFDGSRPLPNAYGRVLGRDGTPRGEPIVLFDTNVPNGFRLARSTGDRSVLGFCGRFGGADHLAGAWIDGEARAVIAPARRATLGLSCGAAHPEVHVAGALHLFAHTDNGGGSAQIVLDVADASGTSLATHVLAPGGGDLRAPPRIASIGGRALVVAGVRARGDPRRSRLLAVMLDGRGAPRRTREIEALADRDESWFCDVAVAAVRGGFVAIAGDCAAPRDAPAGRLLVRFDADGAPIEGPIRLEPERHYGALELAARGAGLVMSGLDDRGLFVALLDAEGRMIAEWSPSPAEGIGLSGHDLDVDGSRVWLLYPAGPLTDAVANPVRLRALGCLEP